ncbi:peptidase S26B, signal peptidase [Halosimplex carlsbadense 2-9-1]|uniref:Peptidase S26B, signal peptidase n=1 Tax=Halosimplex carlsbadense 2-9-1 TaxID=797114 RepID=M0CR60_9EURY|nr:signal peptidase I [Halosimplex carlsbadense]ELZ25113.1 peptidase S26B, signal peptidase [Halosimplex carlsbadense 2-9-1]
MGLPDSASEPDWRRAGTLLGTALFVAVVFLFVSSAVPQVVGADESFVVLSDSMSPAIGAGSMVYVNDVPADRIGTDDVITYRSTAVDSRVTHRVIEVVERDGQRRFRTQGDANEEPDPDLVAANQVVGRVAFHIPLIGYGVSFAGTTAGTVLLVVVPALVLLVTELRDLLLSREPDEGGESG